MFVEGVIGLECLVLVLFVVVVKVCVRLVMRLLMFFRLIDRCSMLVVGCVLGGIGWWVSVVGCWISEFMLLSDMVWVNSCVVDVIVDVVVNLFCMCIVIIVLVLCICCLRMLCGLLFRLG